MHLCGLRHSQSGLVGLKSHGLGQFFNALRGNQLSARGRRECFRNAIQRYIFCYQAVTNIDLSALEVSGSATNDKSLMPALLIGRKAQRDLSTRRR